MFIGWLAKKFVFFCWSKFHKGNKIPKDVKMSVAPCSRTRCPDSEPTTLFFLLNDVCLADKQQIPILWYLVWPDRESNPRSIGLEASVLPIIRHRCDYGLFLIIFSENTGPIWTNLDINFHWMVLVKKYVFLHLLIDSIQRNKRPKCVKKVVVCFWF